MDHRYDGNFDFLKGRNDLPEFIKTASNAEPTMFAHHDGLRGFFPIDTPANTWFSAAFFEKNASELPAEARSTVSERITDALSYHGIDYAPMEKVASDEWILTKLGAEIINFDQKHRTVHPRERREKARKIMGDIAAAKDHLPKGLDLPESLSRYGGSHLHDKWREPVLARLRLTSSPEARAAYNGILTDKETESTSGETLAELLEHLDRKHHLDKHWDRQIDDPFYSVQSCVPRTKVKVIVLTVGDKHFHEEDMDRLDRGALGEHLSEDAIDAIFQSKDMHSLPDVVKHIIAQILSR